MRPLAACCLRQYGHLPWLSMQILWQPLQMACEQHDVTVLTESPSPARPSAFWYASPQMGQDSSLLAAEVWVITGLGDWTLAWLLLDWDTPMLHALPDLTPNNQSKPREKKLSRASVRRRRLKE
mmetsp:Transcript_35470/g.101938  ORF Transcript_35470/g.101938 Transcript_35470/m.101938 type:complete len:124 (+) Transcript_35470:525-896(+)